MTNRRVAYLTNQYPKVSHSFIRREIEAIEALGVEVSRFTIREVDEPLVDEADVRERANTTTLLGGADAIATSVARWSIRSPRRFSRALAETSRLATRASVGGHRVLGYLGTACRLADELEARGIRHVHAHFGTNPAAVALLCRLLDGVTYSFTVHGPEEFDATLGLGLDRKIEHAEFVVAISSYGESQLRRITKPTNWPKLTTIRCGLDASYLDMEPTPPPDVRRLVSVGRLAEQKGQLTLVDAAAAVMRASGPFELVLVGDGPMRRDVEERARDLGILDRIRITGWADAATVRREIGGARGFVLPSYAEGLPIVLMEALALARPAISTYVAGIPELVEDGVSGWLVPAGDVPSLADAMATCLEADPTRLFEMGLVGRSRVRERHDARINARALVDRFEAATDRT